MTDLSIGTQPPLIIGRRERATVSGHFSTRFDPYCTWRSRATGSKLPKTLGAQKKLPNCILIEARVLRVLLIFSTPNRALHRDQPNPQINHPQAPPQSRAIRGRARRPCVAEGPGSGDIDGSKGGVPRARSASRYQHLLLPPCS